MKKKHILFVLDYYLPHCGGVETVFEQILRRLLQEGYYVSLLTSRFDDRLLDYEKKHNLEIWRTGSTRFTFLLYSFLWVYKILKKNPQISLIHASTYASALSASVLGWFFKKPVILTVHEVFGALRLRYKGPLKGILYWIFEWCIFLLPYTYYHCVSRYTMNALRLLYAIPDTQLGVIYNGVDTEFWSPKRVSEQEILDWKKKYHRNGRFVVVYYGHAGKSKGLDALIDAIPAMIKYDPDILFVFNIISSRRTNSVLNRLLELETHGFARQIQVFTGLSKEKLRIFVASCDVAVAPSFSEGFGSVHTEVCAMGKPLITTSVASLPEVVSGMVAFVRPGQSSEILQTILDAKKEEYATFEHIPPSHFSWDGMFEQLLTLYQRFW